MWTSLILALLKSVPALRDIFYKVIELDKARNEAQAIERHADKNASVDARIDALSGVHPSASEQFGKTDEQTGLPKGSNSSPGMVPGRAEDHQSIGIRDREEIRHEPYTK